MEDEGFLARNRVRTVGAGHFHCLKLHFMQFWAIGGMKLIMMRRVGRWEFKTFPFLSFPIISSMGKDELLDDRVSARQCKKAVDALHTHASQKAQKAAETELLPRKDEFVWLTVAVKKMPEGKQSFKPTKVYALLSFFMVNC